MNTTNKRQSRSGAETPATEVAGGALGKALEKARRFGLRVFVHTAAIVCGLSVWGVTKNFTAGMSIYLGLICLVARGAALTPQWLGPTIVGIIQTVVLFGLGTFFPYAVFWGGAQAWLQRLFVKRMDMGTEWLVLLFLLFGAVRLFTDSPTPVLLISSFAAIAVLGGMLVAWSASPKKRKSGEGDEPARVAIHRKTLADLDTKLAQLPRSARGFADSIVSSTENILEGMVREPTALEPGHRFLKRYLTAMDSLVDKHIRLARESVITPEIADALANSEETLSRLEKVFAKEHMRLLKNDVTDFSADMAVIDKLLKMDGRT